VTISEIDSAILSTAARAGMPKFLNLHRHGIGYEG
jgi:hypothetical protein